MKLWAILPELTVAGVALGLVPVAGWVRGRWQSVPPALAALGLLVAIALTARMLPWAPVVRLRGDLRRRRLRPRLQADPRSRRPDHSAPPVGLFPRDTRCGRRRRWRSSSPPSAAWGSCSAVDLVLIILFLQMLSLASYLLVGWCQTDPAGNEATLKYFLYAAVALAVMAYGLTFFYGSRRQPGAAGDRRRRSTRPAPVPGWQWRGGWSWSATPSRRPWFPSTSGRRTSIRARRRRSPASSPWCRRRPGWPGCCASS